MEQNRKIEYKPLADLVGRLHPQNPKDHDITAIVRSYQEHGYVASGVLDDRTGLFLAGHGRVMALVSMQQSKMSPPRGVVAQDNDWLVPVQVGYASQSDDHAQAYLIADNRLTLLGGWDDVKLAELLQDINNSDVVDILGTGFDADDLDDLLEDIGGDFIKDKHAQPKKRKLPLDIIFTFDSLYSAFMTIAYRSGWLVGCRSVMAGNNKPHSSLFQPERWQWKYNVEFVDNNYINYEHEKHLQVVQQFKPKYCTVMDIMTKRQCRDAGIKHISFEQVMEYAEELNQYAENVIVIPKYDCLDKIPDKFMLGYSVPTSHGGTPLPPEAFKGRRVHLLGGSWAAQLAHLAVLENDVISIDNNYIAKAARFGSFVYPDGNTGGLTEDLGISPANHLYTAMIISLGNIAAKVKELYPEQSVERITEEELEFGYEQSENLLEKG